jgi:transposase
MEERRLVAARLLRAGQLSQAEIAREVGVSRVSVTRWKQRLAVGGIRALHRRRAPGQASYLTGAEWRQVLRVLARGARRAGFETEQWTLPRIAAIIERRFGVRYHPRSLGRALRARGHDVGVAEPWSIGRLSAVSRASDGTLRAAANPRGMQGYAVGR